jgi:hypothetical protein
MDQITVGTQFGQVDTDSSAGVAVLYIKNVQIARVQQIKFMLASVTANEMISPVLCSAIVRCF